MSLEILGGSTKTKKSNEKYEVELEFQWAGEVGSLGKKFLLGGRYGYFKELHNNKKTQYY